MAVLTIFTLAACGSNDESAQEEPVKEETSTPSENAVEESTELEKQVVIYSTHSEELIGKVVTAFEEKTGVKVEYINLKGELAERVEAEKSNPQADIMFGGASNLFMDLKEKDVFIPVDTEWAAELDPRFRDEDNF